MWSLTFSILGVHLCLCAAVTLAFLFTWFIKLNLDMYVCVLKDSDFFTMGGGGEKDNERLRVTSRAPENTRSIALAFQLIQTEYKLLTHRHCLKDGVPSTC